MSPTLLIAAASGLLVIAGAAAVWAWLALGRRLAAFEEAARTIADGNLDARVPEAGGARVARLARAFNEMSARLADSREQVAYLQKANAWQEIARRLAHEIKNPLTPIQLAIQQLHKQYAGDDPRYKKLLEDSEEIVAEEIATLRRLVDEFSAFAKLPAAVPRRTDLNALVEEFLRQHKELVSQVAFEWEPAEPSCEVLVDGQLMRRVLYNLIENSLQALGDREGGRLSIRAARDAKGAHAYLFIADNGPGISPADRGKVFDSYFTTKASGTGLGLAIVKKIVLEHRGTIAVGEAPAGGASFTITLPVAR